MDGRRNDATNKAVVCGIGAICLMGCLYFFGIPFFFTGIVLLVYADGDGAYIGVGASLLAVSVVMVIAGVATCFYAFKYGSKASDQRRQQARVVIAAPVTTTATAVYPSQEQYPGAPPQYTQFNYTAAPPYSAQIDPAPQYPAATGYAPPPTTEKY